MSATHEGDALADVAKTWWTPDPRIVSKLPKGGNKDKETWQSCTVCGGWHARNAVHLDYVGHADLTRTLIEIDPLWSWEPYALDGEGLPLVVQRVNQLVMWGKVTILGKTLPCVGSCDLGKSDADKELIGDLLRNAALRFGIYGALWSKVDGWEETNADPPTAAVPLPEHTAATPAELVEIAAIPLTNRTMRELHTIAAQLGHPVGSVSKTELVRQLEPLVRASTGAEPWDFDFAHADGAPIKTKDAPRQHAVPFEPVVADTFKDTPGSIRAGLKSTERTP